MSGTFASYPIQGGGGGGGSGTVTSVALLDASSTPIYTITGSPVTTAGTLTFTFKTQSANLVLAGPTTGAAAQPGFRSLVAGDLPSGGNLTDAGTDGITVTGGTGAVLGSGTSLSQHVADTTHNGYLSSTDWNSFSGKGSGSVTSVGVSGGSTGLTTSGGPVTTSGTITLGGTLAIGSGGTGQATAPLAFDALSPITTTGDLIYSSSGTTNARLPIGSGGNVLTVSGGVPAWSAPATSGTVTSVGVSGGTTGLTTSGGPITTAGTITLAGTLAIGSGGTGQSTGAAAFSALSPITTTGDLIYSSSGTTNARLGIGSTGNVLTVSGGVPAWSAPATSGTVTSVAMSVPSLLSVSGSPITSSGTLALTYSGTALPIANGGTASTTAAAAFNALNPMTTTGDLIYESATGVASRLAIGSSTQVLTVTGGVPVWAAAGGGGGSQATPTVLGTVTSYESNIASAVHAVSSANYTGTATDGYNFIEFTTGGPNRIYTLPAASVSAGREITVTKLDGGNGTGNVSFASSGGTVYGPYGDISTGNQGSPINLYGLGSTIKWKSDGTAWYNMTLPTATYLLTTTLTFNGTSGGTTGNIKFFFQRVGDFVSCFISSTNYSGYANTGTGSTGLVANTAGPTWISTSSSSQGSAAPVNIGINFNNLAMPGAIVVNSATPIIYLDFTVGTNAWPANVNGGLSTGQNASFSYYAGSQF